ncbi:MAG: ABC transporter ATP-binding protein [Lachnospiraceae bacterium]|nr:ABC transporter ATP-binding protein [Lachnospiraceae bacterium]
MLEVKNVQKKYGDQRALSSLSFTAADGRIVGFLGPNGAGKTTAMNIFSGFMEPTAGSVTVCGFDLAKDRKKALANIGYLPENPPLYPEMTVNEYLCFVAGLKGLTGRKGREEAKELMQLTRTDGDAHTLIGRLSKGTKQRIAIAGALTASPRLLLLDEPSNGLDPGQTAVFKGILTGLKKKGTTIIISSHILSQVSAVCDEMLVINRGRLIASGTVDFFEKKLSKELGFTVDIPANPSECEKALTPMKDLCNIVYEGKTADGAGRYSITGYKSDIRKQLFESIARAGLYIESLVPAGRSLEEIYLGMISASESEFEKAQKRALEKRREREEEGEFDENDLF